MINGKFYFLDKRSDDGALLKFEGRSHARENTEKLMKLVSQSKIFEALCDKLPKIYVEGYFKKMIFYDILPISNQIAIYNWENKNKKTIQKTNIEAKSFCFSKLLPDIIDNAENFIFKHETKISILKKKIYKFLISKYYDFLNLKKIYIKEKLQKNQQQSNIGICYREGVSLNKRSDLFCFNGLKEDLSNIILYVDLRYAQKRFKEEKIIAELISKKKLKYIKIWEVEKFKKKNFFSELKKDLRKISCNNYLDKVLLENSMIFLDKVEFWQSFFEKYNIKIHMDSNEWGIDRGLNTIIKQTALHLNGGSSIGKLRSYLSNYPSLHYLYFPNDIFCCWGEKTLKNFKDKISLKAEFKPHSLLITGYPYGYATNEVKSNVQKIKKQLHSNGAKFILLLLDNASSDNKNFKDQLASQNFLVNFYRIFFKWMEEDSEIGLIIKSKNNNLIKRLPDLNLLIKKSINTGRCHIVEEAHQSIPWHYSEISNAAVAFTFDTLPTSLIDCIVNNENLRGVFYDYSNLFKIESNFYSWAKNKIVFSDINKMLSKLKNYKTNQTLEDETGFWPKDFIELFDPFGDKQGHNRVGEYIENLINYYDKGLNKTNAIQAANHNFSKKWGKQNLSTL